MARPKKFESISSSISFRLEEHEKDFLLEKVRASGLNMSDFMRDVVLANKTKIVAPSTEESRKIEQAAIDARRTCYFAAKASNNINQLAHRANSEYVRGVIAEGTYLSILNDLEALRLFLGVGKTC